MPLYHARIPLNDLTPTMVTTAGEETNVSCTIQIQNLSSEVVYIGGLGLSSISYGAAIIPGSALTIDDLPTGSEVYALMSTGVGYVGVLKVNR